MARTDFNAVSEDILENILLRLPAIAFSFAACVSKSWNAACNQILSRPKLVSAFSLNPNYLIATREVIDKVLSEPIRPHFAIVNVCYVLGNHQTLNLIMEKLGPSVPIIFSRVAGIIGRDAGSNEFEEVKRNESSSGFEDQLPIGAGILLTIGYMPGLKVDVVPLQHTKRESLVETVDRFVMGIRNYVATVSDNTAPVGIIMFGNEGFDQRIIMEKLDYAMPMETVIVGDERGLLSYRSAGGPGNRQRGVATPVAALVFARDRNRPEGMLEIQFHVALSNGVSAVGPRYKAVSVKAIDSSKVTWLTARREGQQEILDGQELFNNIYGELSDRVDYPDLYIGVTKRRSYSVGTEKPKLITSLVFHGVMSGDEEYLHVDGLGIRTGDYFQFYCSDPNAALTSSSAAAASLRKLKLEWDTSTADAADKREAFGGLIFCCCGRGKSLFGCPNVDSSPFLENFPMMPLGGIFCGGEIGRGYTNSILQEDIEKSSVHCYLHVYSTVYLVMSYGLGP